MPHDGLFERCQSLCDQGVPFVLVTLIETIGSTPQDQGARMIVTSDGLDRGTVGGGRVEAKAIGVAADMLQSGTPRELHDWSLKADVGMTCGGRVKLFFELFGVADWPIAIFGAGHIAQALTRLLTSLPCQVTCIDSRAEWLAKLPAAAGGLHVDHPPDHVAKLSPNSFVLCMTQGHRSDLPVLKKVLAREQPFPFVGVIGSRAKAAVLRKELAAQGIDTDARPFHCPVGLPLGTNHPGEIAVSIAAQLLQVRDQGSIQVASSTSTTRAV